MQGLLGFDKASSSMYLGEVSSNEMTHLVEEEADISCMTGDDSQCFAQSCYGSKGGGNADVVMAQRSAWLEAKLEARAGRAACAASLLPTGRNTFEQTT